MRYNYGQTKFVERTREDQFSDRLVCVLVERERKHERFYDLGAKESMAGVDFFHWGGICAHSVEPRPTQENAIWHHC